MAFIREVGANTVRLAHYQHSPYFYDACDRAGQWCGPRSRSSVITPPRAHENCRSQMKS
ncbi:MAG: glycoside hydrolase family 2 TIM barrel-domain containing protein [Ruthenibacterium lactatiformans]